MIVFGQIVPGLVVKPVVHRHVAVALGPQQRDQVDALDHRVMLARPVPLDQRDFLSIRFVQRRIIDHQHPTVPLNLSGGFPPERRGIRFQAVQQPGEGIMGRHRAPLRLHPRRFGRAAHLRRGNQKVDVISVADFG